MASASSHTTTSNKWYEIVLQYYPDALSRTYTVPPVHFNRVPLTLDTVPGTSQMALVQQDIGHPPGQQAVGHPSGQQAVGHPSGQQVVGHPSGQQAVGHPSGQQAFGHPSGQQAFGHPSSQQAVRHPSGQQAVMAPPPPPSTSAPPPPQPQSPQVMWPEVPQEQPEEVQESDLRDDLAQARVVRNLEELGRRRKEKMFILSQFNLDNYLNKSQFQVAVSQLPHHQQLGANLVRGELDVLIINRQHGILIGEAKSVGHNHADLKMTQAQSDAAVVKRVQKALKQLKRLEKVVRHVLSDFNPPITVRAALFLPNVTRAQLKRILAANPQLEQEVCQRLGAADATHAAQLCCTAIDMSARNSWWDIPPPVVTKLTKWWKARMNTVDPAMSDEKYLDIVARFVGTASSVTVHCCTSPRVEVRTESEALDELGSRLSCLVLTPQQWDLMSRQPPLMYLQGPPGTGKTVMLVLLGVNWVQNQIDTYVVSTNLITLAISTMIVTQVKKTAASATPPTPIGKVLLRHFDLATDSTALATAVSELSAAALGGARIIMDEVLFDTSYVWGQHAYSLVDHLIRHVPGLHLCCAGVRHYHTLPSGLQVEELTTPLRSAPAILREVRPALGKVTDLIHMYSDNGIPAPGDGQRVRRLRHEGGAHTGRWPVNCEECGRDVATELRQLGVGVPGSGVTYRDVFILCRSTDLQDEQNDAGVVTSQACGVVRGVRGAGMPVGVVRGGDWWRDTARWEREVEDVATAATDRITATDLGTVSGLERKVVVWLHGRIQGIDDQYSDEEIDDQGRLAIVTRCTTQLVVVEMPP